ncbi:MAG: hypothetical protein EXR79_01980 [Myxococcales bacterium]|nr:hypothetical protein [Myxococcales bacterium]
MAVDNGRAPGDKDRSDRGRKEPPGPPQTHKGMMGSEKAGLLITHMEQRLEQVRRAFRAYFLGFDRLPPGDLYRAVQKEFREFQQQQFSVAAARFKAQNVLARWNMLRATWERDLVRMEEGRFPAHTNAGAMKGRHTIDKVDDLE